MPAKTVVEEYQRGSVQTSLIQFLQLGKARSPIINNLLKDYSLYIDCYPFWKTNMVKTS